MKNTGCDRSILPTGQRKSMTNSEPRSLFELSQKPRPRDIDRFEKPIGSRKNRYSEHKFGGFAEPLTIRFTRNDLLQFELAPPLSITIPSVCLSRERKRAIDDYRHLLQTMSLIIIYYIMYCICLDYHNKHSMHRKP